MILQGYDHALMNLIPPDAGLVVEIGCGEGRLGADYKRRNPGGTYAGLETDDQLAALAATRLDRVITSEDYRRILEAPGRDQIHCLVIHLNHSMFAKLDAFQVIQDLSGGLSEQGVVLLGFANPRYWQSIKAMIPDTALPEADVLHLMDERQQVTRQTVEEIVQRAGLKLFNRIPVDESGPDYRQFLQTLKDELRLSGSELKAVNRANGPAYCILRAVKKIPAKRMLIQSMTLPPIAACNDIRIHQPELFLATIPGVMTRTAVNTVEISQPPPGERRVLIWQRPIMTRPDSLEKLRLFIRAGYLVKFDDDPRRWPTIVENDYLSFRGVHGVQTTTGVLADLLRQFNPNVEIFPNQIMELPEQKDRSEEGIVRIFFGALNREGDWQPLMPALNRVLKKNNGKLHINVVHDRAFYDQLETSTKSFQPVCDYGRYLRLLQASDISLLPLEPTEFNRYKSDLKFIENAAHRVVTLASPVVYGESIREDITGMLFHNVQEFEDKLDRLVTDKVLRRRISDEALQWVINHRMLNSHYRRRYEWYRKMLKKLPELNLELKQRMPGLFN